MSFIRFSLQLCTPDPAIFFIYGYLTVPLKLLSCSLLCLKSLIWFISDVVVTQHQGCSYGGGGARAPHKFSVCPQVPPPNKKSWVYYIFNLLISCVS